MPSSSREVQPAWPRPAQLSPDDVAELVDHLTGWNFRKVARFAEEVVRSYVSRLDPNRLEAAEPPVPGKEDCLVALAGFRQLNVELRDRLRRRARLRAELPE